jgi:hypothetical protein
MDYSADSIPNTEYGDRRRPTITGCSTQLAARPFLDGRFAIRSVWTALVATWAILSAVPAFALVVVGSGTESPPTAGLANPAWENVTNGGSNYIYLGDSWVLSARHVGVTAANFNIGGNTVSFNPIPNQNFIVSNPAGSGLTAQTDLRLIRINGIPAGLPSIFDANPAFSIATQDPSLNDQVMFVGQGNGRADSLSGWDNGFTMSVPVGSAARVGYVASGPYAKRWGLNNIVSNSVFGDSGGGVDHTVNLLTGDGITRDVVSLATEFDQGAGTYETQAVGGNSGSSIFRKNPSTNQWELAGIVNAIFTFPNQPGGTAVFGDLTTFADLSFYHDSLYSIFNSHQAYSISGDINLDGVVSGNGTGPAATDDVTAFVQGWGSQQATGDINSWKKGDLNLDGKVDVLDFLTLRQAFTASGSGASLSALSALVGQGSAGGVPEPSSVFLGTIGAALLAWFGHRRRALTTR